MNIRNVLRTYSLLRQLNDDESALLNTLRSLSDSDREQLVETMAPAKGTGKGIKKPRKKREAKSPHAQSLSSAIQRVPKGKVEADNDDGEDDREQEEGERCTVQRGDLNGATCGLLPDHNVHQMTSARGYHPFVSASDVDSAGGGSSVNDGATSTTANSGEPVESAVSAAGGSSE